MFLYACTIFVSAFLLFQVQPIIAKIILPWFGGSASVWTICLLFFQTFLLGGYLYTHWTTSRLKPRTQSILHMILLLASVAVLPIVPGEFWKPSGEENPAGRILILLSATVGIPYLLLSTTGPLVQAWFARANPGVSPYRLFALSNTGSMLALLGYPVLVEPLLPTRRQGHVWSWAYVCFVLLCVYCAWRSRNLAAVPSVPSNDDPLETAPGWGKYLLWVALAACASTLLLAVTTHLTVEVAPIPFLWVLPLSLYLLSFILTFDGSGWYRRSWFLVATGGAVAVMTYMLIKDDDDAFRISTKVIVFATGLFLCCMSCHGELARMKPHPRFLTGFFLMISIGGALGGLFVGVLAPTFFNQYLELPVGMAGVLMLLLLSHWKSEESILHRAKQGWTWILAAGAVVALLIVFVRMVRATSKDYNLVARNFYGELRTRDYGTAEDPGWARALNHGTINHGEQYLHPSRSREATSYFGPGAGVARAIMAKDRDKPQRVGITGLGAGVMISYARPGDYYRIYEINPLVIDVAKKEFTFIKDCPAKLDLVLGDARLSLEKEREQQFDVLYMDAFSSDAVPVHLLTAEAFQLCFRHLKADGILVYHISNRYLDLEPVVARAAEALGKSALVVADTGNDEAGFYDTHMVLLANSPQVLRRADLARFPSPATKPGVRLWTDDYSNLFRIVK